MGIMGGGVLSVGFGVGGGDGSCEAFVLDAKTLDEAVLFFFVVEFGVRGALGAVGEGVGAFGVSRG
jgi:hypothetical protein